MQISVKKGTATCVMDAAVVTDGVRQMIADIKVKELLGGMSACTAVTVDFSATTRVDAVGLLFLISVYKTYVGQHKAVTFTGCSADLRATFAAMGLDKLFGLDAQGGAGGE